MTTAVPSPGGPGTRRVAMIGSGAGTTTAAVLAATASGDLGATVAVVIGNNSRSGLLQVADDHGVPAVHLSGRTHPDDTDRDRAMAAALTEHRADLVVLAGYLKKVGPIVRETYRDRIVNTHPALLPAYGSTGMYGDRVHAAVLADGARRTGVTIHRVTENYDEGPILAQLEVSVEPGDDVATLRTRVQAAERALLLRWLADWAAGDDNVEISAASRRPNVPR
ncbi:formyltransferase family protein [Microlunatus sp. GCM10028923]|uniref:formyltransferase family protein n=1 Tax=Microlunatus sp. GCM10028923 TaxID=3273400 RepID=UPI00360FC237